MLRYWAWANRMPKIGSNMLIYLRRHTTRRQWHTHPRGKKCKLLARRNTWAKMAKRRSRLKRAKNAFVSRYIFAVFFSRALPSVACAKRFSPPLNSSRTHSDSHSHDWPTFARSVVQVGGCENANKQPPHKYTHKTEQKPATNIFATRHYDVTRTFPTLVDAKIARRIFAFVWRWWRSIPTWSVPEMWSRVACHIVLHTATGHSTELAP